jgi:hypothetical protein
MMANFTKTEWLALEKPESILHSTRCPLDTLEKPDGRSLEK